MSIILPLGKLSADLLSELIPTLPINAPELIIPPGVGCDAAGLQIGSRRVAVTTDPITFATRHLAYYSVCTNINDVACMGCRPRWYSGALLLPPDSTEAKLREIWSELSATLKKYDLISIGGHVEVTASVNIPVLVGQVIGEAISHALLNPANAQPGDHILLWQSAGIEGTALLALELQDSLPLSPEKLLAMQNLIHNPGICIWPFVEQLLPHPGVIALHDPTEGGVATALHELADAARCGLDIDISAIPILPETRELQTILNFDPLGLLASGALLVVCKPSATEELLRNFKFLVKIGQLSADSGRGELPRYAADEVIRFFS